MKPWRRLIYWFGLAVGGGLLVYQVWLGFNNLDLHSIKLLSPIYLGLSFAVVLITLTLQMISWRILMNGLQVQIPFRGILRGYFLSFVPRYIPGSIFGYLGRSEWLFQRYGVQYTVTNFGSFLEILTAMCSGALVLMIANLLKSQFLWIGAAFLPLGIWWILSKLTERQKSLIWLKKWFPNGILEQLTIRRWLLANCIFTIQWLLYGLSIWLIASAFSNDIANLQSSWISISSGYYVAWMAGFVILFAPGGLGFREWVLTSLLTQIMGSLGIAAVVAIMTRIIFSAAEVTLIGLGLLFPPEEDIRLPGDNLNPNGLLK